MNQLQKKLLLSKASQQFLNPTSSLLLLGISPAYSRLSEGNMFTHLRSVRTYHPNTVKKYWDDFHPTYYDNPVRQSNGKGKVKYNSADPLWLDERTEHVTGGVQVYVDTIKDRESYDLPFKYICWIFYQMAKREIYDQQIVRRLEPEGIKKDIKTILPRHAMGILYSYYRMGWGCKYALDHFELNMTKLVEGLHIQDIIELLDGFNMGLSTEPEYMIEKMNSQYKAQILKLWDSEAVYHQRVIFELLDQLETLGYFDEEIWVKAADTLCHKKRINNIYFFDMFYTRFTKYNNDPKNPLFKKLDKQIQTIVDRHYTLDRKWRYTLEDGGRLRTLQELIDVREEPQLEDFRMQRSGVDQGKLEHAKAIERKLKRLRMAKLDKNVFDEILDEMMNQKKTLLEMQAELDVDEQAIQDAQDRIAKKKQTLLAAQPQAPTKPDPKGKDKKAAKVGK
ncbi:UNKNOWN [Stylonychia lemnae]|uniref:Uncharacterized protein n=1 Tax=Stylonychia lemnae TaxID=5949 RepID=A0A078ADR7_STYLE|nr:UNKNOWN [Stylonychia lemnae]|eukprot:CDW79677.1 UNKNOWN [Stylonychia lemnae]